LEEYHVTGSLYVQLLNKILPDKCEVEVVGLSSLEEEHHISLVFQQLMLNQLLA